MNDKRYLTFIIRRGRDGYSAAEIRQSLRKSRGLILNNVGPIHWMRANVRRSRSGLRVWCGCQKDVSLRNAIAYAAKECVVCKRGTCVSCDNVRAAIASVKEFAKAFDKPRRKAVTA